MPYVISLLDGLDEARETFTTNDFTALGDAIVASKWSPGTFHETTWTDKSGAERIGRRRTIDNFAGLNVLALDVDGGCTINEACNIFQQYQVLIATTRNHQVAKGDAPACDRFRILIPLERTITSDADFKATWYEAQRLCPAIDPACKDASRFYYPSKEIVMARTGGRAFPVSSAPITEPRAATVRVERGAELSPSVRTLKFVSMGAADGAWHAELVAACMDLKQQQWSQEAATNLLSKATGELDNHDLGVIEDVWANRTPRHPARIQANDALKRLIKTCHMLHNVRDPNDIVMVDLADGHVHDIHLDTVKAELSKNEFAEFCNSRQLRAYFTYDPRLSAPLTTDRNGIYIYNTYRPPAWREDSYYRGAAIAHVKTLPALYAEFFEHLTAGAVESREYLLDWLATSLQGRNFTILTALGTEGIGKGTLGEIMKLMHGDSNFSEASDNIFKKQFNGKLEAKTLVYVDEIDLKTKESQDRIKAVVNEYIEIEKKGIDSVTVRNHASFYISSNELDAIKLSATDRRYSVIELTDTPLKETPLIARVLELVDPANVAELGRYLYRRRVTHNMLSPFRSRRFDEAKVAGLQDWEVWLLDEFVPKFAGGTPSLSDAQAALVESGTLRNPPGRRKFEALSKKYPDMFKMKQSQRHAAERVLVIPKEPRGYSFE